ncbi:MAG: tRNA (N(6)-L-threonylcarbamoyladenosine(37)-C(2))-methylthiotransferase MtaB [Deltaproteobacteria bacterium]|nr:tRNA (N(6)-L-threonylcarbamoyladenosine(37)-C(2))-methylthiotransferase MtaB [Deltaproteobacteria bacterium]
MLAERKGHLRVSIQTLGCKSNQYDSSALEEALRGADLEIVPFPEAADACIINTCTVTGKTDYQSRQLIRRVRKINPDAVVIVTGCYAQVSPEEVSRIEGVDFVVGNPEKDRIVEFLRSGRQSSTRTVVSGFSSGAPFTLRAHGSGGRTRANLKVQEGCNRACSYCIIPKARGSSKSLPLPEVRKEIETLIENGYREIILTGIHLGAYGNDLGERTDLTSILRLIENEDYPCRFRISSLDPDEVTGELIDILKGAKRVCNHLHLPLQSGDDAVIRGMRRPYTAGEFAEKVRLASMVKEISIGVDVIAGFPGEGEREFENTFSLLRDLPVSYLHIFPFSKRKGTPAAVAPGQVDPKAIRARCEKLKELDTLKRLEFYRAFIDKTAEVLVEGSRDKNTNLLKGRARNYIPVAFQGDDRLKNTLTRVALSGYNESGMDAMISGGM